MAHPHPFYKIVAEGTIYGTEAFAFGFHVIQAPTVSGDQLPPVTQAICDAIGEKVVAFFGGTQTNDPHIMDLAKITRVKVNRIGTDGHYEDAETMEYPVQPAVAGTANIKVPPQNAIVVSLVGNENPRALAGRGRFYLPPVAGMAGIETTGKLTTTPVLDVLNAAKELLDGVNDVFSGLGVQYAYVGNTSRGSGSRAGRAQVVSEIRVGNVVDTVRSRRRQLQETYQSADLS